MAVYGHMIRNTLLLAAMEFENECKGLLSAHSYTPIHGPNRWNTSDFVKVLAPLRLADFEVSLGYYPSIEPRNLFSNWCSEAPTKSLAWYDAYNAVKHDREMNFDMATLAHAIDAVAGCAIMLTAQYRIIKNWRDQIGDFFKFSGFPDWSVEEQYINRTREDHPREWKPVAFRFD